MKKTIFGFAFLVLIGLVIWGAANRTATGIETEDSSSVTSGNHASETLAVVTETAATPAPAGTPQSGSALTPGDGDGIPDASENMGEIVNLNGTVSYVDGIQMVVDTSEGQVLLENRPWTFLVSLGFTASVGDELRMTGFYEDGVFEVMTIELISSGTMFTLRDEDGRPMWSGGRG